MIKIQNVSKRPYKIQVREGIDKNTRKPKVKKHEFFPGAIVDVTEAEYNDLERSDLFKSLIKGRTMRRPVVEREETKQGVKFVRTIKTITESPEFIVSFPPRAPEPAPEPAPEEPKAAKAPKAPKKATK